MIQEFYISVTPVGGNDYLVRTERVAPGVPLAEEQFKWPVEDWLSQAQTLMNDPLLALLQEGSEPASLPSPKQLSPTLIAFGQQLYRLLFTGTIRDSWMTAQGIAHHRREVLRLRLGLKGFHLPCLPWEVIYADHRSIATGTDILFSRYRPTFTPMAPALSFPSMLTGERSSTPIEPCLKVLMVIAVPADQENLELQQEVKRLQQELQHQDSHHTGKPKIELTVLEQPDREQLTQALEQGHYQVLHYAGHSNLAATGGALYLVSRKTGLTEVLSGDDLAGLLVNNGVRMAVFNSCRGAITATTLTVEDTRERSLAEALVQRGIPAVLAMAERIPDEVALTLTRLFYRNLKQGYPVDLSVNRARQGLVSAYGSHQLYWALPVLYMHPEFDGYLTAQGQAETSRSATQFSPTLVRNHPQGPSQETGLDTLPVPLNQAAWQPTSSESWASRKVLTSDAPVAASPSISQMAGPSRGPANLTSNYRPAPGSELLDMDDQVELADLIDDLEYGHESDATTASISELVRQLSYETEETAEPIEVAPLSENLMPPDGADRGASYLEIPEKPGWQVAAKTIATHSVTLEPFQNQRWTVKDFVRVRCIPFTDWAKTVMQLNATAIATTSPSLTQRLTPPRSSPAAGVDRSPHSNFGLSTSLEHDAVPTRKFRSWLWWLVGSAGISAVVVAGVWFLMKEHLMVAPVPAPSSPSALPSASAPPIASPQPISKPTSNPNAPLAAQAMQLFQAGNLKQGQRVVEQLLERSAFEEAATVLNSVNPTQAQDASIHFLKGRLALQSIKAGKSTYKFTDAQKYLEAAVQAQPNLSLYSEALGFAYYATGNYLQANQAWFRSLAGTKDAINPDSQAQCAGAYTPCAGLALILLEGAKKPPGNTADLRQAVRLRKEILSERPQDFQPEVLDKQWMWPKKAVSDWRSLLAVEISEEG